MIPVSSLVARLRSKVDILQQGKDSLSQDGTSYIVELSSKPIVSGSESVYLVHTTFTTGIPQFIPRNTTQTALVASGLHITYNIDYTRGELRFYQGSGTIVVSTGLVPFAPWSTSTVIAYYDYTKYSDTVLGDYVSYAVASVEASLQLGMFVSGFSGVAPYPNRYLTDNIDYRTSTPYASDEKFVIVEDVEIIQELIAQKAAVDLAIRERRVGAGGAVRLRDGDTEIDTSVNQRYLADFVKDISNEYQKTLKWIMHNMLDGFNLKQIDERAVSMYGSRYSAPYIEGYPSDF